MKQKNEATLHIREDLQNTLLRLKNNIYSMLAFALKEGRI